MAYSAKTDWKLNDTVMPADMNRIEQGIKDVDTNKRNKTDIIPISLGGTGKTTPAEALAALFGFSNHATKVLSGGNLNSCTSVGMYTYSSGDAASISNVPEANSQSTLFTIPRLLNYQSNPANITQVVISVNARVYIRTLADNVWSSWTELYGGIGSIVPVAKGGTGQTSINGILTNWGIQVTSNMAIYISPSGNDTSGTGASATPYKTLTKALSVVPKNTSGKSITIYIAPGTYSENVVIKDFLGPITLNVTGSTPAIFNSITVDNCTVLHIGQPINLTPTASGSGLTIQNGSCWIGSSSLNVAIGAYGISVKSGSRMAIQGTATLSNLLTAGINVSGGSVAYVAIAVGTNNSLALSATDGGMLIYATATIEGKSKCLTNNGGRIYSGAQPGMYSY